MKKAPTFKRPPRIQRHKNTVDSKGHVKVSIYRVFNDGTGSQRAVKGNIIRTITLADTKVSVVSKTIMDALGNPA